MAIQGSNELNMLLKAKVVKIRVELDYKGSNLGKQVNDITKYLKDNDKFVKLNVELLNTNLFKEVNKLTKYLKDNKKNVQVGVELAINKNRLNGQIKSITGELKKSKDSEPIKIDVAIDVKGSAQAIKKQLKEVHDLVTDFNKKYSKQLAQMQQQQAQASQKMSKSINGGSVGAIDASAYVNSVNEAKKHMRNFGEGFFSSREMKDAQGNLNGFVATLTKANGVIESIKYEWDKEAGKFLPINQQTVTATERAVGKALNSLRELDREIMKLGKNQNKFWKDSDSLYNSSATGKLTQQMVDDLKKRIKDEQALEQAVKKENDALREQRALIAQINRERKGIKNQNTSVEMGGLKRQLESLDVSDPNAMNQINAIKRQMGEITKAYNAQISKEKELEKASEKRLDVLSEIKRLEKSNVLSSSGSGAMTSRYIAETKALAKNIKTMDDYIVVRRRMDATNREQKKLNLSKQIDNEMVKLKESMFKFATATGLSQKSIETRFDQVADSVKGNLEATTYEVKRFDRLLREHNAKMALEAKRQSVVPNADNARVMNAISNKDTDDVKKYVAELNNANVAMMRLSTNDKGVTRITAQFESSKKTAKELTYEIDKVDGKLRQVGERDVFNANRNLGIFEQLRIALARVPVWMTAMTVFYGSIASVRAMATEILRLDTALTELRRVASDSLNIESVFEGAVQMSKELGNNIHDVMQTVNDLARTFGNFNERQLLAIANTATLMANVSDLTAQEAGNTLVGTMNAFNISASESIKIVDALNEVDNNYAISTKQLAEGLSKSASTAKTFGVSMEESVGHITAIGAVTMESGAIIGNSLKTIYSRITTLDKSQEVLKGVGVEMHRIGENGQKDVRPVADILGDLALRWDELGDSQRQNIAVQVAGRYQLSRFLAMMNNWDMALEATNTAVFSQGSAMRENAEYLKSFEARINSLKNSFTELSSAVGDAVLSSAMMEIIRGLTALAGVAVKVTDSFGALPVVLLAVFAVMNKMNVFGKVKDNMVDAMETIQTTYMVSRDESGRFASSMRTAGASATMFGGMVSAGMGVATKAVTAFKMAWRSMLASTIIGGLFVALGFAIEKLTNLYSEHKQKQEELVKLNKKMVDSYRSHSDGMDGLIAKYEELANNSSRTAEQEAEYLKLQKQLATELPTTVSYIDANGKAHMKTTEEIKREVETVKELSKAQAELTQAKFFDNMEKRSKAYMKVIDNIDELNAKQQRLKDNDGKSAWTNGTIGEDEYKDGSMFSVIDNTKAIQESKVEILMAEAEKTEAIQKTVKAVQGQALAYFESQGRLQNLGDEQQAVVEKFISYNEAMLRNADTPEKFEKAYKDLFSIGKDVGDVFAEAFDRLSKGMEDDPLALGDLRKDLDGVAKAVPETFFKLTDEMGKPVKTIEEVQNGLKEIINVERRVQQGDGNRDGLIKRLEEAGLTTKQAKGYINDLAKEHQNAEIRAKAMAQGEGELTASLEDLNEQAMEAIDLTSRLFGYTGTELEGVKSHLQLMHLLVDAQGEAGKASEEYAESQNAVSEFLNITNEELEKNQDKYYNIVDALGNLDLSQFDPSMSWESFINKSDLDKEMKDILLAWDGTANIITGKKEEVIEDNKDIKKSVEDIKDVFEVEPNNGVAKAIKDAKTEAKDDSWIVDLTKKANDFFTIFGKKPSDFGKWMLEFIPPTLMSDLEVASNGMKKFFDELPSAMSKSMDVVGKTIDDALGNLPSKSWNALEKWGASISDWFNKQPEKTSQDMSAWWDGVGKWFDELPSKSRPKLEAWYTDIRNWITTRPEQIKEDLTTWTNSIIKWWEELPENTSETMNGWGESIGTFFDEMPAKITEKLIGWKNAFVTFLEEQDAENKRQYGEWGNSIATWFEGMPDRIKEKLGLWGSGIGTWFSENSTILVDNLAIWWTSTETWWTVDLPQQIGEKMVGFGTSISEWFSENWNIFYDGMAEWIHSIPSLDSWDDIIGEKMSGFGTSVKNWFTDNWNIFYDGMSEWIHSIPSLDTWDDIIKEKMDGFSKSISDWFKNLGENEDAKNTGKDLLKAVEKGVEEEKPHMIDKIAKALLDAPAQIRNALFILMLAMGREKIRRYIEGMESMKEELPKEWDKFKKKSKEKLVEMALDAVDGGIDILDGLIDGLTKDDSEFAKEWDKMKQTAKDKLKEMKKEVVDIAEDIPSAIGKGISNFSKDASKGMKDLANAMGTDLEKGINGTVIAGINSVLTYMGVAKNKRLNNIDIPKFAKGTNSQGHKGGQAIVGEEGRELAYIPNVGYKVLGKQGSEIVDLPRGTSVLPNKETEILLKKHGFPAYANGVGDWFNQFFEDPKSLLGKVWGALPKISMPSNVFGDMAMGGIDKVKGSAIDFIGKKMKDFFSFDMSKFGGGGSKMAQSAILQALKITGQSPSWLGFLMTVAQKESGFNPRAINLWDINAKRGIPSKGMFQTIDPTFNAYKMKGMNDIWNPLHNAVAAIRYMLGRYGGIGGHPAYKSMANGGGYRPYANGGFIDKPHMGLVGEDGDEMIIPLTKKRRKRGIDLWLETAQRLGVFGHKSSGGQSFGNGGSFGAMSGEGGGEGGGGDSGTSGTLVNSTPSYFSGVHNLDGGYDVYALEKADLYSVNNNERILAGWDSSISNLEANMNGMNKATLKYRDALKQIIALENGRLAFSRKSLAELEKRQTAVSKRIGQLSNTKKHTEAQREEYNKLQQEFDNNLSAINSLELEIINSTNEIKNKSVELFTDFIDEIVTKYDKAIDGIKAKIDDTDFTIDVLQLTKPDDKKALLNAQIDKANLAQQNQSTANNKVNSLNGEWHKVGKSKGYSSKEALAVEEQLKTAKEELEDFTIAVLQAEKEIKDTRGAIADEAIDTLKDYYTNMKNMAVDAIEAEKKAVQDAYNEKVKLYEAETDKINSEYDKRFSAMDEQKEEETYQEELDSKNAKKAELLNKINLLSRDTSLEGKKRLADVQAEMTALNEEIADFQEERADALLRSALEEQKQTQLDAVEAKKEEEKLALDSTLEGLDAQKEAVTKQYDDILQNEQYWADMRNNAITSGFGTLNTELGKMKTNLDNMQKGIFDGLFKGFSGLSEGVKNEVAKINELDVDNMSFGSKGAISDVSEAKDSKAYTVKNGKINTSVGTKVTTPNQTTPPPKATTPSKSKPSTSKPSTTTTEYYTIKKGDTFSEIEDRYNLPYGSLQKLNPNVNPRKLQIGQKIVLRKGTSSSGSKGSKAPSSSGSSSLDRKTTSALNFRSSAGYGNNVMMTIPKGAKVDYIGMEKGWAKIKYNGKTGFVGSKYLQKFDTGGYTGDWAGNGGRVAMLHKKELVLNERQTSDILDVAKIIDRVASFIPALQRNMLAKDLSTGSINVNNTYELNVYIERLTGDKKGADTVTKEIMKGLKKLGK